MGMGMEMPFPPIGSEMTKPPAAPGFLTGMKDLSLYV
jgi:hypothetical protein